jgi:hypothetical protein
LAGPFQRSARDGSQYGSRPAWDAQRHGSNCARFTASHDRVARLLAPARVLRFGHRAVGAAVCQAVQHLTSVHRLGGLRTADPDGVLVIRRRRRFLKHFHRHWNPDSGLPGIAEGWYWAVVLAAGWVVTAVWYRRVSRRAGTAGPGWGFLATGLLLTAAVIAVPLLVMPRALLPGWLWLSGQWASGTFALLVIAVALGMLARDARSGPLAVIALAYTAAALTADWPTLRSAPSALTASGGDPLRTLVSISTHLQPAQAALLPALVLLVTAAMAVALLPRLSRKIRAG